MRYAAEVAVFMCEQFHGPVLSQALAPSAPVSNSDVHGADFEAMRDSFFCRPERNLRGGL